MTLLTAMLSLGSFAGLFIFIYRMDESYPRYTKLSEEDSFLFLFSVLLFICFIIRFSIPRTINKRDLGGHHSLEIILFNYSCFLESFSDDLFGAHVLWSLVSWE